MGVLDAVAVAGGLTVVVLVLLDAFDTLLATGMATRRLSPSTWYFVVTWRICRSLAVRVGDDHRRERWLGLYGPASFVALLVLWTAASILGWGLVWWGVRGQFRGEAGPQTVGDAVYYSGVVYFSIGFGDLLPGSTLTKLLSVAAALDGLGTLGLVIGYLPSLNAAYQERESQILLLDDLTDARITPVSLVASRVRVPPAPGEPPDLSDLESMFEEWERWCAAVFQSHSSLPMLTLWRSKHRGHSWITALGVVTDAAIDHIALVPGAERGPPMRLYRQSVRLVTSLSDRFGFRPEPYVNPNPAGWRIAYDLFADKGVACRPFDRASPCSTSCARRSTRTWRPSSTSSWRRVASGASPRPSTWPSPRSTRSSGAWPRRGRPPTADQARGRSVAGRSGSRAGPLRRANSTHLARRRSPVGPR